MSIYGDLRHIFYPQNYRCILCGIEIFGGEFCRDCICEIPPNSGTVCPVCGRKTSRAEICPECKAHAPVFKKAASALLYDCGVVHLIGKFKNGEPWIADYLAPLMAAKLNALPQFDLITFVPCTPAKKFTRGYDHAEELARRVAALCGVACLDVIRKTRRTRQQKALTRKERLVNLKGAFKADKQVKGRRVLIIDDIITTGATLDCVSEALKKAGAAEIYALTAASVEYRIFPKEPPAPKTPSRTRAQNGQKDKDITDGYTKDG